MKTYTDVIRPPPFSAYRWLRVIGVSERVFFHVGLCSFMSPAIFLLTSSRELCCWRSTYVWVHLRSHRFIHWGATANGITKSNCISDVSGTSSNTP